jgi:sulfate adenylyltransferase subunit 2
MSRMNSYLSELESEAIFVFREAAAQFSNPCILFSGGKDSISLVHLAVRAFAPCPVPFPVMHIDTGHNFPEVLRFRDALARRFGLKLIVRKVEDTIRARGLEDPQGKFPSRNALQSHTLLDAIGELQLDACIGGARRDEEKARAKERIFSLRDRQGRWVPDMQRPEVWNIYNGRIAAGETFRVFPISNWTEMDVWNYISENAIDLPSLYFSHSRRCVVTPSGQLMAMSEFVNLDHADVVDERRVRYRTVGDMTCTAAIESHAANAREVIAELEVTRISERGQTRMDDRISEAGMEDRKKAGYF